MIVGEEEILIKELYYVLMKAGLGNVKRVKTLIKHGCVKVNGHIVYKSYPVSSDDEILCQGQAIRWPFVYYMLNKPKGYLSASYDCNEHYVLELFNRNDCFCLGRLDRDTTGLLIITNDASLKSLLLPQNHITKTYRVQVNHPLDDSLISKFKEGILIDKNVLCLSANLCILNDYICDITICEGKYHQVKKMFLSCGYVVVELKRISFACLNLDESLALGEYRELTRDEIMNLLRRVL